MVQKECCNHDAQRENAGSSANNDVLNQERHGVPLCHITGSDLNLIRFSKTPDDFYYFDPFGKLGTDCFYLKADQTTLKNAFEQSLFGQNIPFDLDDLLQMVESYFEKSLYQSIALARRSSSVICGFEKLRTALEKGNIAMVICAKDTTAPDLQKLQKWVDRVSFYRIAEKEKLGTIFDRDHLVYLGIKPNKLVLTIKNTIHALENLRITENHAISMVGNEEEKKNDGR